MKLSIKLGIFCGGLLVCVFIFFAATDSTLTCVEAPIIRKGVRPGATFQYQVISSPSPNATACINNAFVAWNEALRDTTHVQFFPVTKPNPININVIFTDIPLEGNVAGATVGLRYDTDGFVTGFGIMISKNPELVSTCDGYHKVVLHEIGHGLGLGHPFGINGTSVMNMMSDPNDAGGNVALAPTTCDIEQTITASMF